MISLPALPRVLALAAALPALAALAAPSLPSTNAWLAAKPRESHDLSALAAAVNTPDAAFAFVRDEIAYEPYAGVMKGAAGALLTRGANDVDRALLLAHLLSVQGLEVRLVRGRISADRIARLRQRALQGRDAGAILLAALPPDPVPAADSFADRARRQLFDQHAADRRRQLDDALAANLPDLAAARPAAAPATLTPAADHVWVRATLDGKPVDLDPSFADSKPGEAPAEVADTWPADALPEELFHTWHLAVVAEWFKDGHVDRQELLGSDRRAVDLVQRNLRIAIVPAAGHGADAHVPVLVQDGETTEGTVFKFRHVHRDELPGAGGLLGGFGGGDDEAKPDQPADPDAPRLVRLAVEVTLHAPGLPDETSRRVVLDRLELQGARWRIVPELADDDAVAGLLVQAWDAAVDVGAPNPLAVLESESAAVAALDPARAAAAENRVVGSADVGPLAPAPQLTGFFLASGLHRHRLGGSGARAFLVRPRVAFLRHGFTLADWTQPGARRLRYEEGLDLANAPFGFVGEPDRVRDLAVRLGLRDTALEQFATASAAPFNTIPFMAAARAARQPLRTVTSPAQLAGLAVPAATLDVLRGELAAGRVLVLPAAPLALRGTHVFGWWSVNPATGYAIGQMELGGAQALTEKAETEEKVSEFTQTYVKIMGNALKCFKGEVTKALKQDVKAAVLGGEIAKTPDAETAVDCLRKAACDALKDFATGKLSAAFPEAEGQLLRDTLYNWFRETAVDQAGDQTESACQSLLGGSGGDD